MDKICILVPVCSSSEIDSGECDLMAVSYNKETLEHLLKLMDKTTEIQKEFPDILKIVSNDCSETLFISNTRANDDKALENLSNLKTEIDNSSEGYILIDEDYLVSYVEETYIDIAEIYPDKIRYKGIPRFGEIHYQANVLSKETIIKLYKMVDPSSIRFIRSLDEKSST